MNSLPQVLSSGLSACTYHGDRVPVPQKHHLNIYMGMGMWSKNSGLSIALPIDVVHMLLSATLMRAQILEANPGKSSKIIILLADSMAVTEGADQEKVSRLIRIYKKSLEPLLDLLHIRDSAEIILSSELERDGDYKQVLEAVEETDYLKRLAKNERIAKEEGRAQRHYAYMASQTAITRYMETCKDVGIKIGWIYADSCKRLNDRISPSSAKHLKHWDELRFDRVYQIIFKDPIIQFLYTKAGLKLEIDGNVKECVPYTAFPGEHRHLIHMKHKKTYPIGEDVANHWEGVAETCSNLIKIGMVRPSLLPRDCLQNSLVDRVCKMLHHWSNQVIDSKLAGRSRILGLLDRGISHNGIASLPKGAELATALPATVPAGKVQQERRILDAFENGCVHHGMLSVTSLKAV